MGTNTMHLSVAAIHEGVTNLGPGRRVALWVRGCSLRCPGCMSPELFAFQGPGEPVGHVVEKLLRLLPGASGLTVTGGEAFDQAEAVATMLESMRAATDADFMVYTGYTLEELLDRGPEVRRLLAVTDILMDGRYERGRPATRRWRGSGNQRMHLLTDRASRYVTSPDDAQRTLRLIHAGMVGDGALRFVGIPARGFGRELARRLRLRGIEIHRRSGA